MTIDLILKLQLVAIKAVAIELPAMGSMDFASLIIVESETFT